MAEDFLYSRAPLIEVIAEVRWSLTPVVAVPGLKVDPYYPTTSEQFTSLCRENGFSHIEMLVPNGAPTEFLAGQPHLRYRTEANKWPLYQIGPGVFTCNIIPQYQGWRVFRSAFQKGISWLKNSFPIPVEYVDFSELALRYIDAFTNIHGMTDCVDFLRKDLGIELVIPKKLFGETQADDTGVEIVTEVKFPLPSLENSNLILRFGPGQKDGKLALIFEFRVIRVGSIKVKDDEIEVWMDAAHAVTSKAFDAITSASLKEKMGPIVNVSTE